MPKYISVIRGDLPGYACPLVCSSFHAAEAYLSHRCDNMERRKNKEGRWPS